jgi:hypothetical protein
MRLDNSNICGGRALRMAAGIAAPGEDDDGAGYVRGKVEVSV